MVSATTLCWVSYLQCLMPRRADFAPLAVLLLPTILHHLVTSVFDLASLFCVEAVLPAMSLRHAPNTPTETRRCSHGLYHRHRHLLGQQDQPHTRTTTGLHLQREQSAIGSSQREFSRVFIVHTRTGGAMRQLEPRNHTAHNLLPIKVKC